MNATPTPTVKARRTAENYVYAVEVDGVTTGVTIRTVRCTARANFYGLFDPTGERIGSTEFKSALAAAKASADRPAERATNAAEIAAVTDYLFITGQ
jgi:hypothetical protein